MRRILAVTLCSVMLTACAHDAGALPNAVVSPGSNAGAPPTSPPPTSTPLPTTSPASSPTPSASSTPFNASAVHITEHRVPVTPLYVGAGLGHVVYFGFGANGTGSNLYRYAGGAFAQTMPAPAPNGFSTGGGVYGISVTDNGRVFWLSAYFDQSFAPYVVPECGAGGTATLCQPTVDEPTSMLADRSGTFWIAGLSLGGGGQIVTSSNASTSFATDGVMQILNGPRQAVWGVLADLSKNPSPYSVAEFIVSGSTIGIAHIYALPAEDSIASMTVGGDDDFWFTDVRRNAIGRMNVNGSLREFPLRSANALAPAWFGQWQIATACDGAVWFSEPGPNKIGRIDAAGTIDEFALPTAKAQPAPIAAAPERRCQAPELWVGETNTNALAAVSF